MDTILITGGNGFLGRNLITALQKQDYDLRVLALPTEDTSWLEKRNIAVFHGDICQPDDLREPMRNVDKVFHLAAKIGGWSSMRDYYAVNVTGTENVCRAALTAGVKRFVHISSAMAYDMAMGHPVTEDDLLAPLNEPYSMTKAQSDLLVQRIIREDRLPAVIVRSATLFGPGDRLNFGRIADRLRANKGVIIGSGNNLLPMIYISDLIQGLILAMEDEHAEGRIYNIGNDQPLTQKAFFSAIAQEIGAPPPRIHVPYYPLYTAAYMAENIATISHNRIPPFLTRHGVKLYGANNLVSIKKARCELGYEPRISVREGVKLTAAWYQHQDTWTSEVTTEKYILSR